MVFRRISDIRERVIDVIFSRKELSNKEQFALIIDYLNGDIKKLPPGIVDIDNVVEVLLPTTRMLLKHLELKIPPDAIKKD